MSKGSLFTPSELKQRKAAFEKLEKRRKRQGSEFKDYWEQYKALEESQLCEKVARVQSRPEEYLAGLTVITGSRGARYIPLDEIFGASPELKAEMEKYDTPEARRTLY